MGRGRVRVHDLGCRPCGRSQPLRGDPVGPRSGWGSAGDCRARGSGSGRYSRNADRTRRRSPAGSSPPAIAMSYHSAAGRWVLAIAVLGSGLALLDSTVVNVALPDIGRDLHASTSTLQWILNGYLLTLASLILLGGSLGDRYGRRRVFVVGVGVFTAASLLCAVAPNAGVLV